MVGGVNSLLANLTVSSINILEKLQNTMISDYLFRTRVGAEKMCEICVRVRPKNIVKVIAIPYLNLSHDIVCISSLFCDVFGLFNGPFALSI